MTRSELEAGCGSMMVASVALRRPLPKSATACASFQSPRCLFLSLLLVWSECRLACFSMRRWFPPQTSHTCFRLWTHGPSPAQPPEPEFQFLHTSTDDDAEGEALALPLLFLSRSALPVHLADCGGGGKANAEELDPESGCPSTALIIWLAGPGADVTLQGRRKLVCHQVVLTPSARTRRRK